MKKAIVLLSGGIDSATTLFVARKKGYRCIPLIFDYGQRHLREIESAKKIAKSAGFDWIITKLEFPWKGSSLLDIKEKLPEERSKGIPSTYVPARNTIFLAIAVSFAESINASAVFIGAHSEDYSGYPDCRAEYFDAFSRVKDLGTRSGKKIKIFTPLIKKNKTNIIRLGSRLGVPFGLTWSCYKGSERPCGKCDSCFYRLKGFEKAGLVDPLSK